MNQRFESIFYQDQFTMDRKDDVKFAAVLREPLQVSQLDSARLDEEVRYVTQLMTNSPEVAWTIQKLADHAGISRSSLAMKFKDQVGETLNEYLLRVRMLLAERLLIQRRIPVKEIARQSGYQSVTAFSTAFKRWKGATPSSFRKSAEE